MPSITNLLAFIFVLCCGSVFTQLVVHSPPQIAGTYVVSTLTFKGTPPGLIGTTINGTLVTVSNPNSMSNMMLAPYQGIPATDYVIRNYQVFLPSVIVLITNRLEYPGINEFIVEDYQSTDDLIIPVVDIGLEDGFNLFGFLGDNQTAEISLTFSPNIWAEPRQSGVWIAAQILILAGSATCVILCFVKLHKFVQVGGFQFSIAQVCLVILAYANLFTIFHWIVDPTVTRKIMPAGLFSPFFSYPFPFILLAALLTIAYWHELISMANLTVSPFLTKLTKPFFITSILLLLLEYAICIIRAVGGVDLIANIIYQALFLLVNIPTAIYFAWISIKVLIFLSGKALDKKKKRFRKAAVCLSFTFLGLLGRIFLLAYIFGGPTALPIGFFTIFWMAAVFGIMTSLALIFSYQPQHKKKLLGSSSSTGKSTKMDRPPTLSAEV